MSNFVLKHTSIYFPPVQDVTEASWYQADFASSNLNEHTVEVMTVITFTFHLNFVLHFSQHRGFLNWFRI